MTEPLRPLDFDDDVELDPYIAHRTLREAVVTKIRNLSFDELVRLNDVLDTPGFLAAPVIPAESEELPGPAERLGTLATWHEALQRMLDQQQSRERSPRIAMVPYNGDLEELARRYSQQRAQFDSGSTSVWFTPERRDSDGAPAALILPSNQSKLVRQYVAYHLPGFTQLPSPRYRGEQAPPTPAVTTRQALERVFRHVTGIYLRAAEMAVAAEPTAAERAERARLAAQYQYATNPVARQAIDAAAAHEPTPADSRELQRARERLMQQWWEAESNRLAEQARLAAAANAITQANIRALQAAAAAGTPAPVPTEGTLAFAALPNGDEIRMLFDEHAPVARTPRQPYMWGYADGTYVPLLGDLVTGEEPADRVRGEIPEPQAGMLGLDLDSFEPDPPSDAELEAHAASLEAAAEATEPRRGWTEFVVAEQARQAGRIVIPEERPRGHVPSNGEIWHWPVGYAVLDNRRVLGANFD